MRDNAAREFGEYTQPSRVLTPVAWDEIIDFTAPEWLVQDVLPPAGLSAVVGASGCGKTFLVTDIAAHVAMGKPWMGRRVRQGVVLYFAAEGGALIKNRLWAWKLQHGEEDSRAPLHLFADILDLRTNDDDVTAVIDAARRAQDEAEDPVRWIIIDTLARVINGSENDPEDMGRLMNNLTAIAEDVGCHLTIVHHFGKDEKRGARGHSSFKAALDTEIEVTGDDTRLARITKQRDGEAGQQIGFGLEVVELGSNAHGEPVTSCAVAPSDIEPCPSGPRVSGQAKTALKLLRKAIDEAGTTYPVPGHFRDNARVVTIDLWRRYCYTGSLATGQDESANRKAFNRAVQRLRDAEILVIYNNHVALAV
jgi:hypothetical protein